jgi:hypothetical protein
MEICLPVAEIMRVRDGDKIAGKAMTLPKFPQYNELRVTIYGFQLGQANHSGRLGIRDIGETVDARLFIFGVIGRIVG